MEIILTIPDDVIKEHFKSTCDVANWAKSLVAFEIWHSGVTGRKIDNHSPKETEENAVEQPATNQGQNA